MKKLAMIITLCLALALGMAAFGQQSANANVQQAVANATGLPIRAPVLREFYRHDLPIQQVQVPQVCKANAPCVQQVNQLQFTRGEYGSNGETTMVRLTFNQDVSATNPHIMVFFDTDRNPDTGGTWLYPSKGETNTNKAIRGVDRYVELFNGQADLINGRFEGGRISSSAPYFSGNVIEVSFPSGGLDKYGDGNLSIALVAGEYPTFDIVPMSPVKGIGRLSAPTGVVVVKAGRDDPFDFSVVLEIDNISTNVDLIWFDGNIDVSNIFNVAGVAKSSLLSDKASEFAQGISYTVKYRPSWAGGRILTYTLVAITSDGVVLGNANLKIRFAQ